MRDALMSIRPEYSRRIFAGSKLWELRRGRTNFLPGTRVIVYESGKTKAVVGTFVVESITAGPPAVIWTHGKDLGIDQADLGIDQTAYDAYYHGAEWATAIGVRSPVLLREPVPLAVLRSRIDGFRPPQSYRWWDRSAVPLLGPPTDTERDPV